MSARSDKIATDIGNALAAHGPDTADFLHRLRALIIETAAENPEIDPLPEIGPLSESLKWGQPSYTPARPGIGSSVRLGKTKNGKAALYFICHTHMVERFRELYPDVLEFEKDRAIILDPEAELPEAALKHCIAMALTWHLGKRTGFMNIS